MILFFDLDGPLLDVSPRYVALHRELCLQFQIEAMAADRYWAAKRARRGEHDILAELGAARIASDFVAARLERIESPAALQNDRCWPWALDCLRHLARFATLVMVTARADRTALLQQLDALDLRPHFHEILSECGNDRVDLQKAALIRDYLQRHGLPMAGHWMIGDTEADVGAGKHVGLKTIAVLSGIRDEANLRAAEPDFLAPDIRVVPAILDLPPLPPEKSAASAGSS